MTDRLECLVPIFRQENPKKKIHLILRESIVGSQNISHRPASGLAKRKESALASELLFSSTTMAAVSSLACIYPIPANLSPLQWLRFIFTSPCSQRLLFSTLDFVFLLCLSFFAIFKLFSGVTRRDSTTTEPLLHRREKEEEVGVVTTNLFFKLAITLQSLLAIIYVALIVEAAAFAGGGASVDYIFFLVLQLVVNVVVATIVNLEKRFRITRHPISLRVYWFFSFFLTVLSVYRFGEAIDRDVLLSILSLPISFFLLLHAFNGSTGVSSADADAKNDSESTVDYNNGSFISQAFYLWVNPLLTRGSVAPLKLNDVPYLSPDYRAQKLYELFMSKWPENAAQSSHPVVTTLLRCFWKNLTFTAFLTIFYLCLIYVSPTLIQSFIDYTSGQRTSIHEGYYLCGTLFAAKFVGVICSHQYTFQSQKIGMMIRATLTTSLYQKGLRLSGSARTSHGLGQIVNYMAIDAQQLANFIPVLHFIWVTPLQVGTGLLLLYNSFGLCITTSAFGILLVVIYVVYTARRNNMHQFQLMVMRDKRMKAVNEMLNYIKVIKLQAWEDHFYRRIQNFREGEYHWLTKFFYTMTGNNVVLFSTPMVISAVMFATCTFFGVKLDAGKIFTARAIFNLLQEPLMNFPQALMAASQALISLERLDKYFTSSELDENAVERYMNGVGFSNTAVEVHDGKFKWGDEVLGVSEESSLSNINLKIKKGSLTAVVGKVGSGKSSLISCLLGEMNKISGKVRITGSTAYVSQTPWIQNCTIEDNILFGLAMDVEKYSEVLRVCCLEKDLEMMEFGDQTEIGERGINLSGGQKQRIQLARAVYQDSDVYLLDDVFSAVDAHTGSEIFKDCLRGALKGKTVILVTHQIDFLHNADQVLFMKDGKIVDTGKYDDLLISDSDFSVLVSAHADSMDLMEDRHKDEPLIPTSIPADNREHNHHPKQTEETGSRRSKLIEAEEREEGNVGLRMYKTYITEAWGWYGVALVVVFQLAWRSSSMANDYWLAYETSTEQASIFNVGLFLQVYIVITTASIVLVTISNFLVARLGLTTSQIFFNQMLDSILRAPMSFFDTTPSGRILSRASTDQTNLDLLLPIFMGLTSLLYIMLVSQIMVMCHVVWPTMVVIFPLGFLYFRYRRYYLTTSRELTRLDSITKAPVIHHFSESVSGVTTIRCFRKDEMFNTENVARVDSNLRMDFYNFGSTEWMGVRMEMIGIFVFCLAAMIMVLLPSNFIRPELVGLAFAYGIPINDILYYAIWTSCVVENRMVSVERIKQMVKIPSEAPWKIDNSTPPPTWPAHGNIDVVDLKVRYRENTPLILKSITFKINGGENIGIVGRTGSGKSTLIQTLFRIVEPAGGRIVVDGIDICTIGLHNLRSKFGIIPQEPVLFQGTIRTNIDPIGLYSDDDIWKVCITLYTFR